MEYPFYIGDVQESPDDFAQVEDVDMPVASEGQIVLAGDPQQVGDKYYQRWIVRDLTEKEILDRKIEILLFMARDKTIDKDELKEELLNLSLTAEQADDYIATIR